MNKIRMKYDPLARAAYLQVTSNAVETTVEFNPDVVIDFDSDGNVVGVEILEVDGATLEELQGSTTVELDVKEFGNGN